MITEASKVIDGKTYACKVFPGRQGVRMGVRLTKAFGPLLLGLIGSGRSFREILDSDLDIGALVGALVRLDAEEVANLMVELLAETTMDGRQITPGVFDLEFAGNYGQLRKVLIFAIEHNNFHSAFSDDGIGDLTVPEPKVAAASPASSTRN